jgi:hypothetical protein
MRSGRARKGAGAVLCLSVCMIVGQAQTEHGSADDRPSGARCSKVQLLSSSREPFALKKISFTREYIKVDPVHPSKLLVNFGYVLDRITDRDGYLAIPALEPGTYMVEMHGAEKAATGTLEIHSKWMSQMCSQIWIVEEKGSYMQIRALR